MEPMTANFGIPAFPQIGYQPSASAYDGQAGFDQFNPVLAQLQTMAAFNLGGRTGGPGVRANSQNSVVGTKTASRAMVVPLQSSVNWL